MLFAKITALTLLVVGVLIWAVRMLPPFPDTLLSVTPREELVASPLPASDDGPAILEGTAIYDTSTTPPVPYIEYAWGDGVRTKQLIYRNERGCSTASGDLPCVTNPSAPSPSVPYGGHIRVRGTIRGDQILVDSVEQLEG